MAVAAPARKMTAEEFLALPGELPHPQLIDGELVFDRGRLVEFGTHAELIGLVHVHRQSHPGCGELGLEIDSVLDEVNVYAPDLWWVPDGRRLADDQSRFGSPPPLVVEVRSPSTWRYDIGAKLRHYEAAGVAEVWLVDTAADVVLVFRRRTSDAATFDVALGSPPPTPSRHPSSKAGRSTWVRCSAADPAMTGRTASCGMSPPPLRPAGSLGP